MNFSLKATLLATALALAPAHAAEVEYYQGTVTPSTVSELDGVGCRNFDKPVRITATITWPKDDMQLETMPDEGLIVWTSDTQFSFPRGAYAADGESFKVDGYFTPRSGGTHQGITATFFEPTTAPAGATEVPAKGPGC